MPMCKKCGDVVGVGQINENGICNKCLSTGVEQKEEKKYVKQSESKKTLESTKANKGSGMKVFFYILAVLAFLDGIIMLGQAQSAIHQILGYMALLIATIFLSSGGIISAITANKN